MGNTRTKKHNYAVGNLSIEEQALIALLYDASINHDQWPAFLTALKQFVNARAVNLVFHDAQNRQRNLFVAPAHSEEFVAEYLTSHIDNDIGFTRLFLEELKKQNYEYHEPFSTHQLASINNNQILINDELKKFHEKNTQHGHLIGLCGLHEDFTTALLSIHFHPDQPAPSQSFFNTLQRIQPHFQRTMRIHHQLTSAENRFKELRKVLQHNAAPMALLDSDGRVHFCNHGGADILQNHPAIRIGHNGRLQAADKQNQQTLNTLITKIANAEDNIALKSTEYSIPLNAELHRHPLKITILPLQKTHLPSETLQPTCIAVFFNDPEREWHVSSNYLQQAYGLTRAECDIAHALVNGATIRNIATQRTTSEETVRWQLKCLLQKTHTNSQLELVRLLTALSLDIKPILG